MRRLIISDLDELMSLVEKTRGHCGRMTKAEVLRFLSYGRVEGVFLNAELGGVSFCGYSEGFCTDGLFFTMTKKGTVRYLRVLYDECLFHLIETQPQSGFTVLHYRHLNDILPLIGNGLELIGLRGGVGNKPCLVLQSGETSSAEKDYLLCAGNESKELSRCLDRGYRAVASMGNKLILTR